MQEHSEVRRVSSTSTFKLLSLDVSAARLFYLVALPALVLCGHPRAEQLDFAEESGSKAALRGLLQMGARAVGNEWSADHCNYYRPSNSKSGFWHSTGKCAASLNAHTNAVNSTVFNCVWDYNTKEYVLEKKHCIDSEDCSGRCEVEQVFRQGEDDMHFRCGEADCGAVIRVFEDANCRFPNPAKNPLSHESFTDFSLVLDHCYPSLSHKYSIKMFTTPTGVFYRHYLNSKTSSRKQGGAHCYGSDFVEMQLYGCHRESLAQTHIAIRDDYKQHAGDGGANADDDYLYYYQLTGDSLQRKRNSAHSIKSAWFTVLLVVTGMFLYQIF